MTPGLRASSSLMLKRIFMRSEPSEVAHHDRADEDLQQEDEFALGDEVGLAGLVDQLRDLAHRAMDRQVLELCIGDETEEQAQDADDQSEEQECFAAHAEKRDQLQVRQHEVRLGPCL